MEIDKEISKLTKILELARAQLADAPEGYLKKSQCGSKVQFYHLINGAKRYIKKDEMKLVRALFQKRYDRKVVKIAEKQLKVLNYFKNRYVPKSIENIEHGSFVKPFAVNDEEFAKAWLSKKCPVCGDTPGDYVTASGDRVRSKSEVIIADRLYYCGIPYRYEEVLRIGGRVYYPDFTVLNKRNRKVFILEHFGMMDNSLYATNTVKKLNTYATAGYILGQNLLCTFETLECPLNTATVNKLIETYLK